MKKIDTWINENEGRLMDQWEVYKYEHFCGEYFHHDDCDYFNEDQFNEMATAIYLTEKGIAIN